MLFFGIHFKVGYILLQVEHICPCPLHRTDKWRLESSQMEEHKLQRVITHAIYAFSCKRAPNQPTQPSSKASQTEPHLICCTYLLMPPNSSSNNGIHNWLPIPSILTLHITKAQLHSWNQYESWHHSKLNLL